MDNQLINDIVATDNEIIDVQFAREGINPPNFHGGWNASYTTKKNKQQCFDLITKKISERGIAIHKTTKDVLGIEVNTDSFYTAKNSNPPFETIEFSIRNHNDKTCSVSISVLEF